MPVERFGPIVTCMCIQMTHALPRHDVEDVGMTFPHAQNLPQGVEVDRRQADLRYTWSAPRRFGFRFAYTLEYVAGASIVVMLVELVRRAITH